MYIVGILTTEQCYFYFQVKLKRDMGEPTDKYELLSGSS